jgi:hypothetical protein
MESNYEQAVRVCTDRPGRTTVTRDNQRTEMVYVWHDGNGWQAFTTPDGVGRYFYPLSETERAERGLEPVATNRADVAAVVAEVFEVEGYVMRVVELERYTD